MATPSLVPVAIARNIIFYIRRYIATARRGLVCVCVWVLRVVFLFYELFLERGCRLLENERRAGNNFQPPFFALFTLTTSFKGIRWASSSSSSRCLYVYTSIRIGAFGYCLLYRRMTVISSEKKGRNSIERGEAPSFPIHQRPRRVCLSFLSLQ